MWVADLLSGRRDLVVFERRPRTWSDQLPALTLVLSGSFRPLHHAHRALLHAGTKVCNEPRTPMFEISLHNVQKPSIAKVELLRRLKQFNEDSDIIALTRAAAFVQKARLMPETVFVIGYDTAIRLFDNRFYFDAEATEIPDPSTLAISEIRDLGCSFVVGGRHDADGKFKTLADVLVPSAFVDMFTEIPETAFKDPISSTSIRVMSGEP